jgi:hypothetical protein
MKLFLFASFVYLKKVSVRTCIEQKEAETPCQNDEQCLSGICFMDKCYNPPNEVGSDCGLDNMCGGNLGCDMALGKCTNLAKIGEICQQGRDSKKLCEKGLYCYENICRVPGAVDSRCSDNLECGKNLMCMHKGWSPRKTCIPKLELNKECRRNAHCQDGLYCNRKFLVCLPLEKKGAKCTGNDCIEDLDCLMNLNALSRFLKPFYCDTIPSKGKSCSEKCKKGYYCAQQEIEATQLLSLGKKEDYAVLETMINVNEITEIPTRGS